ncbi:MAG: hypothetical protein HDR80_06675 [Bacteroides sp.]|nr:hypothetical protein [Bacteroides sp.]
MISENTAITRVEIAENLGLHESSVQRRLADKTLFPD